MLEVGWDPRREPQRQLNELLPVVERRGVVILRFAEAAQGPSPRYDALERWLQSRAVTVADIAAPLADGALDVALCCDAVYIRSGVRLELRPPAVPPTAGVVWACGRAGAAALRHGLLVGGEIDGATAVALGLAMAVVERRQPLPVSADSSLEAMTAVRDLQRSRRTDSGGALELASFRLLFATGHPREGAAAFLDGRTAVFPAADD